MKSVFRKGVGVFALDICAGENCRDCNAIYGKVFIMVRVKLRKFALELAYPHP